MRFFNSLFLLLLFTATVFAAKLPPNQFVDSRDKQKYRTVKIADRTWLADNLNYKMEGSYCYKDDDSQCDVYGRLYTWAAAKQACPAGFRLANQEDFQSLWTAAGEDYNAGYLIKSSYGWSGDTNGNDTLKFGAMPAGNRFDDETYGNVYKFAFFWSADAESVENAYLWYLTSKSMAFSYTKQSKAYAASVRCVKK